MGKPRRLALALAAAILPAGGCGAPPPGQPGARPNVLVLVVDCLRYDRLSPALAHPAASALRAFAAEATSFDLAFSQASWTRPSVATLLTGLYPSEHGLGDFREGAGQVGAQALSPSVLTLAEALRGAGYSTALIGEQFQLSRGFGLDQGFDFYHYRASKAGNINDHLVAFGSDPAHQPFFAYLHYLEVHWPYCPPEMTRGALDAGGSTLDFCADWRQLDRDLKTGVVPMSEADRKRMESRYDEELMALDQRFRAFFAWLQNRGLWDDTMIILTGDHGEEFFEHQRYGHGNTMHDEVLHVPLVIKPPRAWRAPAGRRLDFLVETRDIVATALEAAGVDPGPHATGKSLVPWLGVGPGPDRPPHDYVASESNGMVAVRTREWKLIVHAASAREELFDLVGDPDERHDLAAARPAELQAMRARLMHWRQGLRPTEAMALDAIDEETEAGLKALGYIGQ